MQVLSNIFEKFFRRKTPQELGQELMDEALSTKCNQKRALALIAAGAAIDEKDEFDNTALIFAARNGHADIVRALLDRGAAIDEKDKDGWTALMWAAVSYDHPEIVQILLDHGAAIDLEDNIGCTALKWAVAGDHKASAGMIRAEQERRRLVEEAAQKAAEEHTAWVRAGMPVNRIAPVKPLQLKKKERVL